MTSGILNVLKPCGMTSHDVVGFLRRTLQTKKIGHGGTLDPDAAGVLPVFIVRQQGCWNMQSKAVKITGLN